MAGSAVGFFLFNAGLIALVRPLEVDASTGSFYLPVLLLTIIVVALFLATKRVDRRAGAILVLLYAVFALGGFVLFGSPATP